jgi:hypothetical protein
MSVGIPRAIAVVTFLSLGGCGRDKYALGNSGGGTDAADAGGKDAGGTDAGANDAGVDKVLVCYGHVDLVYPTRLNFVFADGKESIVAVNQVGRCPSGATDPYYGFIGDAGSFQLWRGPPSRSCLSQTRAYPLGCATCRAASRSCRTTSVWLS